MAAPLNTTLLDDFNRGTLGSTWTTVLGSGLKTYSSTQVTTVDTTGGDHIDVYNVTLFGPTNIDAYAKLTTYGATGTWIELNLISDTTLGSPDGYAYAEALNGANNSRLFRIDNGAYTQIGSSYTGWTAAVGDYYWIEKRGSTFTGYNSTDGVNWTQATSTSDSTYTGPFYIGLNLPYDAASGGIAGDDLRGGTVTFGYPVWLVSA